jgi:hypothetical protein
VSGVDDSGRPETPPASSDRSQQPPAPGPWKVSGAWNIPDVEPEDPPEPGRPLAALVSFHYLRAAVRRRRLRCLLAGLVGLVLAAGFLVSGQPTATTTLLLTRAARNDTSDPMATDMALLSSRTVALRTTQALGLAMAPEDFLASVRVVSSKSSDLLQLTMTGPTTAEAVRRLDRFSREYLDYRAKQILAQADALQLGYRKRIATLQQQVDGLNERITDLGRTAGTSKAAADSLSDAITQRQKLIDGISVFEGQTQDAAVEPNTIRISSRVIDDPAPVPAGGRRHVALVLATGLIVGLALGLGLTVLQALLSDRLWLRAEVASALGTRIPVSVRRLAPPRVPWLGTLRLLPWIGARRARRSVDRQLMAHALTRAVAEPGPRHSLTVLCLGNSDDMRFGVAAAAVELLGRGTASTVIDLTVSGRVQQAVGKMISNGSAERPEVVRPRVVPSLTEGPSDLDAVGWDDVALAKAKNGVILVVADFDPAVGVDHLAAWADRVVVAVTAGRSSVELVRTTGELVRAAGLHLQHAVLLEARGDDISSGVMTVSEQSDAGATPTTRPGPDAAAGGSRVL